MHLPEEGDVGDPPSQPAPDREVELEAHLRATEAEVPRGAEALLVALGQMPSPDGQRWRVFTFAAGERLAPLSVGWLSQERVEAYAQALGRRWAVRRGECDAMYATPWELAWTTDAQPFLLWDGEGLLARQEAGQLRLLREGGQVDPAQAVRVSLQLSPDWTGRAVRVHLRQGEPLVVRRQVDPWPLADPTYDGLSLLADTAWAHSLGRAVARALGVPWAGEEKG